MSNPREPQTGTGIPSFGVGTRPAVIKGRHIEKHTTGKVVFYHLALKDLIGLKLSKKENGMKQTLNAHNLT